MNALIWTRRLWMRLGVISALSALIVGLISFRVGQPGAAELLRIGAVFQFSHALAVFACAGFMACGASQARHAAAPFLAGSALFAAALYGRALALWDLGDIPLGVGAALMAAGWGVLFVAASGIEHDP